MMTLEYPANALFFSNIIIQIVNVDLLDPQWLNGWLFDFSKSDKIMEKIENDGVVNGDGMLVH